MDGRLWSRWMVVKTEPLINITESQVIMSKNWGSKDSIILYLVFAT